MGCILVVEEEEEEELLEEVFARLEEVDLVDLVVLFLVGMLKIAITSSALEVLSRNVCQLMIRNLLGSKT